MSQKQPDIPGGFKWTTQRDKAAQHVAEDTLTNEQIAEEIGVALATLKRWKSHPEFADRVESIRRAIESKILEQGIARRTERIRQLDATWKKCQRVIDERSVDPTMADAPGGTTGLLVRTVRVLGYRGADADKEPILAEEYAVDTGLLKEMRELLKQAAVEMGEWGEKREVTGTLEHNHRGEVTAKHVLDPEQFGAAFAVVARAMSEDGVGEATETGLEPVGSSRADSEPRRAMQPRTP